MAGKKKLSKSDRKSMVFKAHLANFEATRKDMTLATEMQNSLVNYSIALVGGVAVYASTRAEINSIVWLVISILLSLMTWASLEYEIRIHDNMYYIDHVLKKKIQMLVVDDDPPYEYQVFIPENVEVSDGKRGRTVFRAVLVTGKFLVSYVSGLAFLCICWINPLT